MAKTDSLCIKMCKKTPHSCLYIITGCKDMAQSRPTYHELHGGHFWFDHFRVCEKHATHFILKSPSHSNAESSGNSLLTNIWHAITRGPTLYCVFLEHGEATERLRADYQVLKEGT